jgi:hypothetical protein
MLSSLFALCSPVDERLNPIRIMLHGDVTSFMSYSGYITDALKITLLKNPLDSIHTFIKACQYVNF